MFSQVCNHPELFERADVVAPFSFALFGQSGPLNREGDFISLPYSTRNPIEYAIPALFYQDGGLLDVPNDNSRDPGLLSGLMNIWSTDWIHHSLYDDSKICSHQYCSVKNLLSQSIRHFRLPSFYRYVAFGGTCHSSLVAYPQETPCNSRKREGRGGRPLLHVSNFFR
jgi:hypothetical protein